MEIIAPIFIIFVLGFLFIKFAQDPLRLTMYMIAFQKIIDMTWFLGINIGTKISLQRVVYVLIPLSLLAVVPFRMAYFRKFYQQSMPMVGWMVAFVVWIIFCAFRIQSTYSTADQIADLFRIIGPYAVFIAGWQYFDNEEKFDEFARLFVITYALSFFTLLLQYFGIFDPSSLGIVQQRESGFGLEDTSRYTGIYFDGGSLSVYLITLSPLCLYLLSKKDEKNKWIYLSFLGVLVITLSLARVRTTALAVIAGIFTWYFFKRNYLVFGLAVFGGFYALFNSDIINKFFGDVAVVIETGSFANAKLTGRTAVWNMIMDDFNQNDLFTQMIGLGIGADERVVGLAGAAHSDYYTYLYNTGYVGVFFYFAVIYVAAFLGIKNILTVYKGKFTEEQRGKYYVWLAIHVFYMIGFYAHPTRWVSYTFPLWFLAGFALKNPHFFLKQKAVLSEESDYYYEVNPKLSPYPN
ncbi:MAG: hypothetical protein SFU91_05995 [Chloroherpetonaceae bacterium]|nr:hypothetical protein [Chloroherpetonaceae bacterium]